MSTLALLAVPLGLSAGVLTTLAGQGGGLLLLLFCSFIAGPHAALAVTAPALLLGNVHRAFLFRKDVDRRMALRLVAGALPGAFAGGLLAGVASPVVLHVLLVGLTALSIAKAIGWLRFSVPNGALGPAGFVVGTLTGTSGGAGVLFAPLLLATGLTGRAFIGTIAVVAVSAHVGRVVAYGWTGLFSRELLFATALVAAAIFVGNALGERVRRVLSDRTSTRLEYGVLVVCVLLSVSGLA